ncbi:substrate-binding periplasmic protein [Cognaticolwellia mytili]|uniref:substrate-binding periplasmic protein n=1 Tax=Cognaticolwellia mytili TaxID=1888913 RepID=UPI000A16FE0A|nr:transporter substrate-binding domain-containing protein [Cognaticolwellia mytili]
MFNSKKKFSDLMAKCSILFSLCNSPFIYAETVSVWGEYHPPLNGMPGDSNPGFMIEIASSILKKNGHTINYILGPRARGVQMVRSGEIDCVVNAKIKDHSFLAFPDEPWGYHAATLFALPTSKFQYQDIAQLKETKLGAIADMRYDNGQLDDYLKRKNQNISFSYGSKAMYSQVKKLVSGRTDLLVSCPLLMRGQLESMNFPVETVKIVGEVKPFVGMYFACGNKKKITRNMIEAINVAIPVMRKNGELKSILDKYGQIDWVDIHNSLTLNQ